MEALFNGRFRLVVMATSQMSLFHETVLGSYLAYLKGKKDMDHTKISHKDKVCTTEWKIEIGCHGCSVAMVTNQNTTSIINSIMSSTICYCHGSGVLWVRDVLETSEIQVKFTIPAIPPFLTSSRGEYLRVVESIVMVE